MSNRFTEYGFKPEGDHYVYTVPIMDGAFQFVVYADGEKILRYTVIDPDTDEEYVIFRLVDFAGPYVEKIRNYCNAILDDIEAKCFSEHIFKTDYTKLVIEYISKTYGVSHEFPWKDENAVFREKGKGKWFAVLLTVKRSSLGLDGEDTKEVLNLKAVPERVSELIKTEGILPAYHMNKKHWYTAMLDSSLEAEQLLRLIDESYMCVTAKHK